MRGELGRAKPTTSTTRQACGLEIMTSQRLAFCALGLLGITQAGGCSGGQCPTIACQPQVQLTYARPITGPYHIAISYRSMSFEADCPGAPTASPGITSCDGSGVLVTGVDLGHG